MFVLDEWELTPFRLAVHQPTHTAVIADLHLGYREARQQSGEAVPLLDVHTQLTPLRQARRRFKCARLIIAGDLFERCVREDLLDSFLAELEDLDLEFAGLVPGNHDRGWEAFTAQIPIFPDGLTLGRWRVVHGDDLDHDGPLVLGHWHPAARVNGRRVPCYVTAPGRLILPAFSADAAGQCLDGPFSSGRWERQAIVQGRVVSCSTARVRAAKSPRTRSVGFPQERAVSRRYQ